MILCIQINLNIFENYSCFVFGNIIKCTLQLLGFKEDFTGNYLLLAYMHISLKSTI